MVPAPVPAPAAPAPLYRCISFYRLIKFRGYPIAMVADVGKAFHQVIIASEDRRMI